MKDNKDIYSFNVSEGADDSISVANSRIVSYDEKTGEKIENESEEKLHRGMKSRHLALISLSGAIGTGLFVGSGASLAATGPGPLLLGYIFLSGIVYFVMNILAEMSCFLSTSKSGSGAGAFINDYLHPDLGFAFGYNYVYAFAILSASEVSILPALFDYFSDVHPAVWITIFLVLLIALNMAPVKFYGESEFWFGSIKLITLTGLIILGIVLFFGGGPTHDRLGFRYWKNGNAFHQHLVKGDTGRFLSVWTSIIKAGYSFICSPELIVAGASEVERPRRNIKKAANSFIYRLAFFYIFGSLIIGIIADSRSPELLNTSGNASASPFVLGIQNAGIPVLNQIINAVVLTSAASAGSSFLYAASRSLFSLSKRGLAPKIFAKTNRYQVPYVAVLANSCVTCLAYLNVSSTSAQVFTWLSNISTISGFIAWVGVAFAYIRWRKAIVVHNLSDRVPLRTPLQPYGAYIVIVFISLLTLTNGYAVFFDFNVADFFAAYVTFIFVFVLYLGRRLYSYFIKGEKRWLTPLEEVSFEGLDEFEAEDASYPEVVPRNLAEKAWLIIV